MSVVALELLEGVKQGTFSMRT